jgi:cholesterol transport system auxiliary component
MEGLNKQYSFTQSIWTEPLNKTITQEIVKSLRESRIFKSVQLYKSRSKSDYLLETNIENFVQHFSKDEKTSYVEVRLTFSLLNLKDNSLVESKTFTTEVESKTLDAEGGVEALSTALSKILSQNTFWLTGVCK